MFFNVFGVNYFNEILIKIKKKNHQKPTKSPFFL